MSDQNGSTTFSLEASDADQFGSRTFVALLGGQERHRDRFNPDSAKAAATFAGAVQKSVPVDFVAWACREQLNPGDDKYCTEPAEPFAAWMRARIARAISRERDEVGTNGFNISTITSSEFDGGDYAVTWLAENFIVAGEPMVVAGAMKSMKTMLSVCIAISLALGESIFGMFRVPTPVKVLLLSGESGWSTLQSAGRRIAESLGHTLADVVNLYWSKDLPTIGNVEHMEELRRVIAQLGIKVLVLDPLYFCLPGGDAGNLMIMGELLRSIAKVCEETNCTLIVVHHVKKSAGMANPGEPAELPDVSWSGTAEWARQWLLLSRRSKYDVGSGLHRLWMVVGGSQGHNSLWGADIFEGVHPDRKWEIELLRAEEVRDQAKDADDAKKDAAREEKLDSDKRAIVQAAAKLPERQGTLSDIRSRSGIGGNRFGLAFRELIDDGWFEGVEIVKGNKRSYEGYKLQDKDQ